MKGGFGAPRRIIPSPSRFQSLALISPRPERFLERVPEKRVLRQAQNEAGFRIERATKEGSRMVRFGGYMNLRKTILPAMAILLAACSAAPQAAAQNETPLRTITVNGEGEVSAAPDMAVISIGVQTEADSAAEALRTNSAAMRATIDKLKELGVEDRDIQTSGLSINPRYDYERNRAKPPIIGYTASNTVTVRLRDLDRAGAVIDQAVQSGANNLNGISFTFADPDPLYDAARRDAVADARAKAALLADAAGVELGRLLRIEGGYVNAPQPMVKMARMEADASTVPLAAGESAVTANVTLVYEIN
jgi:hypothetical protein